MFDRALPGRVVAHDDGESAETVVGLLNHSKGATGGMFHRCHVSALEYPPFNVGHRSPRVQSSACLQVHA
jgi:hypothetical protein